MFIEKKWKTSFFNNKFAYDDTTCVFNSYSSQLIKLSNNQAKIIDNSIIEIDEVGNTSNQDLLDCLAALGFVVPFEFDEYEHAHKQFMAFKESSEILKVTIAPTMACNLNCSYCFQQKISKIEQMSPDIQRGIIEFIRKKMVNSKKLIVQWFGGEPLLAYNQILEMSAAFREICDNQGAQYYSEMLTNGTLLTTEIIDSFKHIALKAIHLSLDGDITTFANRKNVSISYSERFHKFIVDNLQKLLDTTGSVTIRINIDRDNPDGGFDTVRMIRKNGCVDKRLDIRLGFLNTREGIIDCIPHDCFSYTDFTEVEMKFKMFLQENDYRVYGMPQRKNSTCIAPLKNAYTIDPDGKIGKCVPAIGTKCADFSRIYPDDIQRTLSEIEMIVEPYSAFDPFNTIQCNGCTLLPACLGGCPRMFEPGNSFYCRMKDRLSEMMSFYFDHNQYLQQKI